MSELKPCPFCGKTVGTVYSIFDLEEFSEEEIAGYPHGEAFAVVCDANKKGCGASGGYAQTKEDAAEKWNRRLEYNSRGTSGFYFVDKEEFSFANHIDLFGKEAKRFDEIV